MIILNFRGIHRLIDEIPKQCYFLACVYFYLVQWSTDLISRPVRQPGTTSRGEENSQTEPQFSHGTEIQSKKRDSSSSTENNANDVEITLSSFSHAPSFYSSKSSLVLPTPADPPHRTLIERETSTSCVYFYSLPGPVSPSSPRIRRVMHEARCEVKLISESWQ